VAKPQLENGHTQIANEILEHLMKLYLSPNQWQVLLCIIRKTYGFKKKTDFIANRQIVEDTCLIKSTVSRALKNMEKRHIIVRNRKFIGIQKDWELWEKLAEQLTVSSIDNNRHEVSSIDNNEKLAMRQPKLAEQLTKVSNPRRTQKKKETIQKKEGESIKRKYGEFQNVLLADEEYQKLLARFGSQTADKIEGLSSAIESKGYKYRSHYATILNWSRRDELAKPKPTGSKWG